MKVFAYKYKEPLLQKLKMGSYTGEIPTIRVKIGKSKIAEAHTTFQQERRSVKAIDQEIRETEKKIDELEKRSAALSRREREELDRLIEHVPILEREKSYTENLIFVGHGTVQIEGSQYYKDDEAEA